MTQTAMSHAVPRSVRLAFLLWLGAMATAVIEVVVRFATEVGGFVATISSSAEEVAIRLTAYVLLIVLALLMRNGRNVARHLLTVIFGGLGLFSLLFEPVAWVADGGEVAEFLREADGATWVMILSRLAHIACVIVAILLAYGPSARPYFSGLKP